MGKTKSWRSVKTADLSERAGSQNTICSETHETGAWQLLLFKITFESGPKTSHTHRLNLVIFRDVDSRRLDWCCWKIHVCIFCHLVTVCCSWRHYCSCILSLWPNDCFPKNRCNSGSLTRGLEWEYVTIWRCTSVRVGPIFIFKDILSITAS